MSPNSILTAGQAALRWARDRPDSIAVVWRKRSHCYRDLTTHIAGFARALEERGIAQGMMVAVACEDRYLRLVLAFALEVIGAAAAHLAPSAATSDRALAHCDVLLADRMDLTPPAGIRCVPITPDVIREITQAPASPADLGRLARARGEEEIAFLGSTSATTGGKKFFCETWAGVCSQIRLIGQMYFQPPVTDLISLYDLTVGAAYVAAVAAMNRGGCTVFSTLQAFPAEAQQRPHSHAPLLLRDVELLARMHAEAPFQCRLDSVRVLGAALPLANRRWLESTLADRVVNSYSANETGQIAESTADGRCLIYPGVEVKIRAADGSELPAGETGLIAVKSPQNTLAYLNEPELSARHFRDGWFLSNDLGRMTGPGVLELLGRGDDVLNVGGIKLAPAPWEQSIKQIDGVLDCVLLAQRDTVVVCIEQPATAPRAALRRRITAELKSSLGDVKVAFFDRFPRTGTGKVQRRMMGVKDDST